MRIALVTYSSRPRGSVVHTLALAEALARLGEDVTVWGIDRSGDGRFFRPVDACVQTRLVPLPEGPDDIASRVRRSIEALRATVDVSSADVIHAQDCIAANAVVGCIRTVHHLDSFTTPALAACHERALREPVAHVCVSSAVAAELSARWGIDAVVIPNGTDYDRFASATPLRRERPYVLAVGGIEPRKGTLDLIEAYALIRRARGDVELLIAGGETLFDYRPYRTEVERRCAELGVTPVVLGAVAHDEMPPLVGGASVFLFPSTNEGFGMSAMEALAAGVPLVVRDLPVFREVFEGAAQFATTPAELAGAVLDALETRDDRRIAVGRTLARANTWDAAALAHQMLYQGVRARRGARDQPSSTAVGSATLD